MVAAAVAVATVLGCAIASIHLSVERVVDRAESRAFEPAGPNESPALEHYWLPQVAPGDGAGIDVYLWRVNDPQVRIPGVPSMPELGSWYLSPELYRRAVNDPLLGERFPEAAQLGQDGVANADELVAHGFVGPDAILVQQLSSRTGPEGVLLGDEVELDALTVVQASLILLLVPVVGLLLAGMAPVSTGLDQRVAILRAIGAARSQRSVVVFIQGALSAAPGALIGAASWYVLSQRLTSVPLVGAQVLRGDLALTPGLALVVGLAAVLGTGLLAVVRSRRTTATTRPAAGPPRRPTLLRLLPLAVGVCLLLWGSGVLGDPEDQRFIAGIIVTTVGTIIALPLLLRSIGTAVARSGSLLALLVGRRLGSDAAPSARALLAFGAIAVIAPIAVSWIALERSQLDDVDVVAGLPSDPYPVGVYGRFTTPDEIDQLASDTDADTIDVFVEVGVDPAVKTPDAVLVAKCEALSERVELQACSDEGFEIPASAAGQFEQYLPRDETGEGGPRRLVGRPAPPDGFEKQYTLFIADDWRALEAQLWAYVNNRGQSGMHVSYVSNPKTESIVMKWAIGGLVMAGAVGALAVVLSLAAHSARLAPSRLRLKYVGADLRFVRWLASAEPVIVIGATGAVSLILGCFVTWCWMQMEPAGQLHLGTVLLFSALTCLAAVGAGTTAWVAIRDGQTRSAY